MPRAHSNDYATPQTLTKNQSCYWNRSKRNRTRSFNNGQDPRPNIHSANACPHTQRKEPRNKVKSTTNTMRCDTKRLNAQECALLTRWVTAESIPSCVANVETDLRCRPPKCLNPKPKNEVQGTTRQYSMQIGEWAQLKEHPGQPQACERAHVWRNGGRKAA